MEDLPPVTYSPLQRSVEKDGETLDIRIFRDENDPGWVLEVVDGANASHCWNDHFESDQEALDAALRVIEAGELHEDGGDDDDYADQRICELEAEVAAREAEIAELTKQAKALTTKKAELLGRLEQRGEGEGELSPDDHLESRIEAALAAKGKSPRWAEGLFVALHTIPKLVPPSVWLDALFDGELPEVEDQEDAQEFFGLLLQWCGDAVTESGRDLEFFCPSPDDEAACRDWARGYLVGFSLAELSKNQIMPVISEVTSLSMVAGTLGEEAALVNTEGWLKHVEEKGLPDGSEQAMMAALRTRMGSDAGAIYEHFREARMDFARAASGAVTSDKVARNAPCPCGSGRKFKKCCGAA